jgi:hypothetical protein
MPCPPFDPRKIIERFQAGEWIDDPDYLAAYRDIWRKQNAIIRFAEKLRESKPWDTPYNRLKNPNFKLEAITLDKEHLAAIHNKDTAYLERLLLAIRLLKKGPPEWHFTLSALIKLAIIHLRENHHRQHIDTNELYKLIVEWQRTNHPRTASDKSQWYRTLKQPEIRKLLTRRQN